MELAKHRHSKFSVVRNATDTSVTMMDSSAVRQTTVQIWTRIEDFRAGKIPDKKGFPAVCWAATFSDGKRHKESAAWTGLAYLDIDHIMQETGRTARFFYEEHFAGMEEEWGIVHAQISPSGDGLHIVFIPSVTPDPTDGLKPCQAAFAKLTGLKFWDANCHDLARMMFLSSLGDTLYDALDTLIEL